MQEVLKLVTYSLLSLKAAHLPTLSSEFEFLFHTVSHDQAVAPVL